MSVCSESPRSLSEECASRGGDVELSAARRQVSIPRRLSSWEVVDYLQGYGFAARDEYHWRAPPPELALQVSGHSSSSGHTYYHVDCSLKRLDSEHGADEAKDWDESTMMTWRAEVRLAHLRAGLHDAVKKALGTSYQTYFCKVPFAQHMRPSGTTARLDAWCSRLAYCITKKLAPPWIAAATLQLLCAPLAVPAALTGDRSSKQTGPPSEGTTRPPSEITAASIGSVEAGTDFTASEPDVPKSPGSATGTCAEAAAGEPEDTKPPDSARSSEFSDFDGCPVADSDECDGTAP